MVVKSKNYNNVFRDFQCTWDTNEAVVEGYLEHEMLVL